MAVWDVRGHLTADLKARDALVASAEMSGFAPRLSPSPETAFKSF